MEKLCCSCYRDKSKWTEDGIKAWSVVLGSFLAHLSVLGMLYSFGIFVIPISQEFGVNRGDAALVGTINLAIFFSSGIFAGVLSDRYGVRPIMLMGGVTFVVGCISASFCYEFIGLFFTQGVLVGFGSGFVYWPAISVVPQWFNRYRGTAVGFAALGSGIGNMLFALAGQQIVTDLGWRNTLRVFGGIGALLILIAIILQERRFPVVQNQKGGLFHVAKRLIKLKNYRWFLFATFFFQWGFFVPFVHLGAYARDLGFDSSVQGLSLAMIGIGSSVGRVIMGPVADNLLGRMPTFRLCMFAAGVTLASWPACVTPESIYSFAFFYGIFGGGFITLSPVIAGDLWGVANLGGTFALLNLVMIPGALACGPIAGLIFDRYGTYWPAIWGGAGFLFATSLALCFVKKEPVPEVVVQDEENPALEEKFTPAPEDEIQKS